MIDKWARIEREESGGAVAGQRREEWAAWQTTRYRKGICDMSRGRGATGAVRLIGLLVALCLALGSGNRRKCAAPVAYASGVGPCAPLTANDLAQPQVTRKGQASAHLSRTQGTNGTQLTLTGSGWPAGAAVGLAIVTDHSGQFLGGPLVAPSVTTSASGALPSLTFRLPSGDSALCQNGMSLNGARLRPCDHPARRVHAG